MSNPVVTVDNNVPIPPDPRVIRKTYTRTTFESQKFYVYAENEYDGTYTTFDATGKGDHFFMTLPISNVLSTDGTWANGVKPDFVCDGAWSAIRAAPSCFVTANFSVMPKIIVPSDILVENGIYSGSGNYTGHMSAYYFGTGSPENLFNWKIITVNGSAPAGYYTYAAEGAWTGVKYVSFRAKDDKENANEMQVKLSNPPVPRPMGSDHEWLAQDSSNLVVGGAFVLFLNISPSRAATTDPKEVGQNTWTILFQFGDIELELGSTSSKARITSGDGGNWTPVSLVEGRAKGGPVQQEYSDDKTPYIVVVYPVWNGVIIGSGVQEARTNPFLTTPVLATSTFVPKLKEASVLVSPWSNGFDPTNPDEVEVGIGTGPTDVTVDFGDSIVATSKNCKFDIAYIPCFFCKNGWFDEWFVAPDDTEYISYDYNVYPIWTKNGTAYTLGTPTVDTSGIVGPIDDTHYNYIQWSLFNDYFARVAGEIFAAVLETIEDNKYPIRNDNGAFDLSWIGGTPGDESPGSWKDYIQSITITTGIEGSQGSITVDKYGPAGQLAEAIQSVGAIVLEVDGGEGTHAGTIFKGLAMGIGEGRNSSGATWSIPLVGLEKKLDDIALINVPFMDGELLITALDFLSRYSGIIANYTNASTLIPLSVSEDINVARFDWKSGTTVRTALEEVMNDVNHGYIVRDGAIYYYQLDGTTGLPIALGTDWKPFYPGTKTVLDDQTPDFDDVRNEIVILGLEQIHEGEGTKVEEAPQVLRMARRSTATNPDIPWSRTYVEGMSGFHTLAEIEAYAIKRQAQTTNYETIGRTTIPGDARIKPFDRWGSAVISSVTHNVDLQAKVWTTDLEFMKAV